MKTAETAKDRANAVVRGVAARVRDELARTACPPEFARIASAAAEQAATRAVRIAEARERRRIVRWLRTVADIYAERSRAGKGGETIYWFDHLKAFSQAAAAIARRRHATPH